MSEWSLFVVLRSLSLTLRLYDMNRRKPKKVETDMDRAKEMDHDALKKEMKKPKSWNTRFTKVDRERQKIVRGTFTSIIFLFNSTLNLLNPRIQTNPSRWSSSPLSFCKIFTRRRIP